MNQINEYKFHNDDILRNNSIFEKHFLVLTYLRFKKYHVKLAYDMSIFIQNFNFVFYAVYNKLPNQFIVGKYQHKGDLAHKCRLKMTRYFKCRSTLAKWDQKLYEIASEFSCTYNFTR